MLNIHRILWCCSYQPVLMQQLVCPVLEQAFPNICAKSVAVDPVVCDTLHCRENWNCCFKVSPYAKWGR